MNEKRRDVLKYSGFSGVLCLAGCIQVTQPQQDQQAQQDQQDQQEQQEAPETQPVDVNTFQLNNFDEGRLSDENELAVSGGSADRIVGQWEGDTDLLATQACERCSFEITENGSVVASTGERILITGYQYIIAQSSDAVFITYQPSVKSTWDHTFYFRQPGSDTPVTPEIRPDEGVFVVEFSDVDIEPGDYNWGLEISPPDSFTVDLGSFDDTVITVGSTDESQHSSRAEAIETAGSISNSSARAVDPPEILSGDGLSIEASGRSGGSNNNIPGKHITRSVRVECQDPYTLGGQTNRQFRINNLSTDEKLTFSPS